MHDILLPFDYPAEWADRFFNEQYLLASYLLGGAAGDEAHRTLEAGLVAERAVTHVAKAREGAVELRDVRDVRVVGRTEPVENAGDAHLASEG